MLEKAKSKFLEEILEPIIADEENSECNANYYKEMYTNKFLEIIEQIISERDKEWVDNIENYRDGWVKMNNNEPEFAPEYQVIQDLINKLQTLNK